MKKATFILSFLILFKPVIPVLEYMAFYDYIKTELCVNKDKPKLQCNGKCYLMKKLAESSESESDNDKNNSSTSSGELQIVFFQEFSINNLFILPKEEKSKVLSSYNNIYKFNFMDCIFHPPLV